MEVGKVERSLLFGGSGVIRNWVFRLNGLLTDCQLKLSYVHASISRNTYLLPWEPIGDVKDVGIPCRNPRGA